MSKFVKVTDVCHGARLRADFDKGYLVLVGSGRQSYLWACHENGDVVTFSGPQALRKLAQIILATVPERKKK